MDVLSFLQENNCVASKRMSHFFTEEKVYKGVEWTAEGIIHP